VIENIEEFIEAVREDSSDWHPKEPRLAAPMSR